jgi:hypothetical protein
MKIWPVLLSALSFAAFAQEIPESPGTDIGYTSPQAALAALKETPGITSHEENGWIVLADKANNTIWSIASEANPAYPTAVKRSFVERHGSVFLDMKVKCGATKDVCDQVVRSFQELTSRIQQQIGQ